MAGDEVGNHLDREVLIAGVLPRIEQRAAGRLVGVDRVHVGVVLLAAVQTGIGVEEVADLVDRGADHCTVVPCGGRERFAAHALQAALEPVDNGQIGLAHPAVAPGALDEVDRVVGELEDIQDHVYIVVAPDVVHVVEGVLDAAPLSVLEKAGLVLIQLAETAAALFGGVRLAVPEILYGFDRILFSHDHLPSWICLISILSTKAWKRVRSWPEAELMYSFSIEQTGMP